MKSKLVSDSNRKVSINMGAINAYTARYKAGTAFDWSLTRRQVSSDPQRGYYYGTVLPCFLKAYWYEPEDSYIVHRHAKIIFFHVQPDERGIHREKDIPSIFSKKPTVTPEQRKEFIDWVIRKCTAPECDNPQYVPTPGE